MSKTIPTLLPAGFVAKKRKILSQLAVPDDDYTDASPKGSVDVGIRDLIEQINRQDGLVTTSSCAGRVSVYLEGKKASEAEGLRSAAVLGEDAPEEGGGGDVTRASAGGKGGGEWLFVSHDPVAQEDRRSWASRFGLGEGIHLESEPIPRGEPRLIHFKFEPMVSAADMA
jgi:tRNA wybutosine-synthesizing protein 3